MNTQNIGRRGTLFTFFDLGIPTNVYVINGNKNVFVIDTYLGTGPMEMVKSHMGQQLADKPVVVVNTHGHWDHIWGNCAFAESPIIAHETCLDFIGKNGAEELTKYKDMIRGTAELALPTVTFTDRIVFEEDGIEIFYSPGHTEDSISVYDQEDKVLYAGDNLEMPLPYLAYKNLDRYVETLEGYLKMDYKYVIGGHTGCEGTGLIKHNLDYVSKVLRGDTAEYVNGMYCKNHEMNMNSLSKL